MIEYVRNTHNNIVLIANMDKAQDIRNKRTYRKQGRHIHKPHSTHRSRHRTGKGDSCIMVKKKLNKKSKPSLISSPEQQQDQHWSSHCSSWLQFDQNRLQACIASASSQLPTFNSIDQLFSLSSPQLLDNHFDLKHFQRYGRMCSMLNTPNSQIFLLNKGKKRVLTVSSGTQAQRNLSHSGMLLSESECELIQKRSLFMEKLKTNESKYDSSIGRMSEISKELAVTYRAYIQNKAELESIFKSFSDKVADNIPNGPKLEDTKSRYGRLLIGKNLRHTFGNLSLDRLNYFKVRQFTETDRLQTFTNISTFEQLQSFIERRKPKRGRKLALATACSVCLSDYSEMSNPLKSCSTCLLRAHELCYSFEQNRCGSCTFQKLEREVKRVIGWCFICRRAGLMVVKLGEQQYAHGFCLLMHGFWGCGSLGSLSSITESLLSEDQSYFPLENRCSGIISQIEFYSPLQNQIVSATSIHQHAINNNSQLLPIREEGNLEDESFSEMVRSLQGKQQDHLRWHSQVFESGNQNLDQKKEGCKACGESFFRNCFVVCINCGQQYHVLCAFLSGCQMKIEQGQFFGGISQLPKTNCCSENVSERGWNRRFQLNYNRCVFNLREEEVGLAPKQSIWEE